MRIEKVTLRGIRCFGEETVLDLRSTKAPKRWAVIVGDNGTGKTTLLRSIAMGLCDKDSASALLRDLGGSVVRAGEREATIRIDLRDEEGQPRWIETTLAKSRSGLETVADHKTRPKRFPWKHLFVCGYGPDRGVGGSDVPADTYSIADAVYTLINYDWPLLAEETQFWRLTHGRPRAIRRVAKWLNHILMLPEGNTVDLTEDGLRIRTANLNLPISACGDGYEATVTWILDLLSRVAQTYSTSPTRPMDTRFSGIVLLDELEQHLHPKWQREIVSRLSRQFENVQFIVTTHSPLCAVGAADIPNGHSVLALLEQDEKGLTRLIDDLPSVAGMRSDQVLASRVFGYLINASPETEGILRRASILAGKGSKRTRNEDREYRETRDRMRHIVLSDAQTEAERDLMAECDEIVGTKISKLEQKLFRGEK